MPHFLNGIYQTGEFHQRYFDLRRQYIIAKNKNHKLANGAEKVDENVAVKRKNT